ncbi:MAG: hypothetical protein LBL66_00845 [Clostridiales bacterium]|nr:hypothetical protein [Clostridiales bacterium]
MWAGDDPLFKTGTPDDYYFFNNMAGGDVGSTGLIPMRDKVYPLLPDDKVIVSCDQYALYYDAVNDVPQIRSGWLRVTGSWAELSRDKGYDFWTFVLGGVSPYYGSPDGGGRGDGKGNLSVEDFRFQDWVQLAFGSMGIEYFVYASNSEFNGPVDGFGAKKPGYYAIQTVHAELQALAPVYFDFDWQGALTVLGGKNKLGYNDSFDEMGGIAAPASRGRLAASSADRDTLIGVFKHPDGHDGYAVVNYSDPYFHKTDNVTLRFTDAARAMIWKRGVREVVNLSSNGSLTLELPYGEGVFVVPAA